MRVNRVLIVGILLTWSSTLGVSCAYRQPVSMSEEWEAPARAARVKNPVLADEKSVAAGKILFGQECRACHGDTGKGNGPAVISLERLPSDLTDPMMAKHSDGALFWKITEGRSPMPSFAKRLSDDARWRIVDYIRTFSPIPKGAPIGSEPPNGDTMDPMPMH